jgi:hypothetical protein
MKTRAQIVTMAGEELLLVPAGNSLDAEDGEKIDGRFDGLIAELSSRGVYTVDDEAEIPDEVSGPLATCLRVECQPIFSQPKDIAAREDAENRLRVVSQRIEPTSRTLKVDTAIRGSAFPMTYERWLRGG